MTVPGGFAYGAANQVLNASGNQAGLTSADLQVAQFRELALDFTSGAFTGGVSPTIVAQVKRKGLDGNYYVVYNPSALNAAGTLSTSIGLGGATNSAFGTLIQVLVVVTGGPTAVAWTLSVIGK